MGSGPAEGPIVSVVGGINLDIHLRSLHGTMVSETSNPSSSWVGSGGVGRNIAVALAGWGLRVNLFGAVGADPLSVAVLDDAERHGVQTNGVARLPSHTVGLYTALLDEDGELAMAASAMGASDALGVEYLREIAPALQESTVIVADTNLPPAVLQAVVDMSNEFRVPLIVEPVSQEKAHRLDHISGTVFAITPNALEYEVLSGSVGGLAAEHTIVTRGPKPIVVYSQPAPGDASSDTRRCEYPVPTIRATRHNVVGAGDAFVAGLVFGVVSGASVPHSVKAGIAAAGHAVVTEGSSATVIGREDLESILLDQKEIRQ